MKLKSLKITAAERKAREKRMNKPIGPGGSSEYPYSTCLRLDKDALEKLGIDPSDFDINDVVRVEAVAFVKALRSSKGDSYDDTTLEIQLTSLGIERDEKESTRAALERGIKQASEK